MKKFAKNKVGFTLVEMILVIALIVIIASVIIISASSYLNKTNTAKETVEAHNSVLSFLNSGIDADVTL